MSEEEGSVETGNPVWTEGMDEDTIGFIENKGWDGPGAAINSYRNLEKLYGADKAGNTVMLPGEDADEKTLNDFYTKLGRPETPDKYEFAEGDPKFQEVIKGIFHEEGLSTKQARSIADKYDAYAQSVQQEIQDKYDADIAAAKAGLEKEWGAAFEQNISQAKKAAREFGLEASVIDSLEKVAGFDGLMKFMHAVGSKLGEDSFEGGASSDFVKSPAQAKQEYNELLQNQGFVADLLDKGRPGHQAAVERKSRLMELQHG